MIAQLTGTIVSKKNRQVIIDVNGVGYQLAISLSTFSELPAEGSKIKLLTYQHFRENAVELFGFSSELEKELFLILIDVQGIGPKTATDILSDTSLSGFKKAIISQDIKALSRIKGVGKKTAEKLAFELKDKIREFSIPNEKVQVTQTVLDDSIEALKALGFTYIQAKEAAEQAAVKLGKNAPAKDIIREALKSLGK